MSLVVSSVTLFEGYPNCLGLRAHLLDGRSGRMAPKLRCCSYVDVESRPGIE